MGKLKDQLAGIAALIAAVVAIGGGFAKYGELNERINTLTEASKTVDYSILAVMEEKITALEASNNGDVDNSLTELDKRSAINQKQIQLLQVQIEELKASSSNPLAN
jgi:hypothetical protein|tara:strand:+ start:45 stop:365 length:321 start_codon:yes stop_codon:yes gene_type:complete